MILGSNIPTDAVFVETNVPLYAAGREHPYREPCVRLLGQVAAGAFPAVTSTEVHLEILHFYMRRGQPMEGRDRSEAFQQAVPTILPVTVVEIERARELSLRYTRLTARDLIHLAVMLTHGITRVATADRHFDGIAEVTRLDPLADG